MSKINADHSSRAAYVYVRQSTADQLANNPESRRRQYGLAARARMLGWSNVIVIDDDLGRSGGGTARPGFERLLAAICTGAAGAVFAIEASRLARNGRDWHTLLEFCALVHCLIIDEDGIYDPKQINDRLLLGMKGTFSEMELSIFRQRSQEALRLKAARGDLHTSVAVGYIRGPDDRLELDPDKRIREALHLAFRKFAEFGSARQVAIWLIDEGIKMPVAVHGRQGRVVEWRLPRYHAIHRLLTNPVYAGAYVFGRTGSQTRVEAGRKAIRRGVRRTQDAWEVLLRDHHEGYISWEEYERNRQTIGGNANMKGEMVKGSVRNGGGLLAGLLRCGHCGRKLKVLHNGLRGVARYVCNDADTNHARRGNCIAFGNMRIDAAVSAEVLRVIAPLGLDAAVAAIAARERVGADALRQKELALEQARYEAARAHRQYDAVDPENRLVAGDLERRTARRGDSSGKRSSCPLRESTASDHRSRARGDIGIGRRTAASVEPSGGIGGNAQTNPAYGAGGDRRHRGIRATVAEAALEGRRPHGARRGQESRGTASLEDQRCDGAVDCRSGARDVGSRHRLHSEPAWRAHGKGQYMDATACSCLPQ
jgi:DNA invertase Pin-like site-specific DNA recombinase